jgi:hypothetical protein
MKHSAALPVAWITLRIMITLVWVVFGCTIGLLAFSFLDEDGASKFLGLGGLPQSMWGVRAIAVMGIVSAPINYVILKRLLDMVETVRSGNPFIGENACRLNSIAWLLLIMELGNIVLAAMGKTNLIRHQGLYLDASVIVNGWLVVLLTFVLARVFAAGATMREDLEGTV